MATSIAVSEKVHAMVVKKQAELLEKGIKKRMIEINDEAVMKGLPLIDMGRMD